jgi:hypothetical protein
MGACCGGAGSRIAPVSEEICAPDGVGTMAWGGISSCGFGISDSGRKGIYVNANRVYTFRSWMMRQFCWRSIQA